MLRQLIAFAVYRPGVIASVTMLLIGYASLELSRASLDIFPEFAGRKVIVQTEAPGYTAEQVELLATRPIEQHLGGLPHLINTRSESIQGLSVVTALFDDSEDIFRIRQAVGERLALAGAKLPPDIGPPVTLPLSSSSATVLTLGLTSDRLNRLDLRDWVDHTLVPRLMSVAGVADVNVFGGGVRQFQIQLHTERLVTHNLGLDTIAEAARRAAAVNPGGFIETPNQRLAIQVHGLPAATASLGDVVLARGEQGQLTLADVATLAESEPPPVGAAAVGTQSGLVLMVIGQYGANTLRVSRAVEHELEAFKVLLERQGVALAPHLFRPADYIERSIQELGVHIGIGAVFVVGVLYAFLFNWRTAVIPALAIPLSLLSAAVVLLEGGINLNIMTLGGLGIALGEVVDDAIIDTENIYRRLRENGASAIPRPRLRVVLDAAMEVRGSVVYASFIVILVFLPLLTLGGVSGRLFAPMGVAYMLAILMSLGVALTITPALCSLILQSAPGTTTPPPLIAWLQPRYRSLLGAALHHPRTVLCLSGLACGVGLLLLPRLGGAFLPELREGHYIVHTANAPGTSLSESMRLGARLRDRLLAIPGVQSVSQWAGRAERGADTYGSHYSEYEVRLRTLSGTEQGEVLRRIRAALADFAGTGYEANTFLTERIDETLSGYTAPIAVNLYGSDFGELDATARQVSAILRETPGVIDVQTRSAAGLPGLRIELQPSRVAAFGLRPVDVATAVRTAFEGSVVGQIVRAQRTYPLTLLLAPDERQDPAQLAKLPLRTTDGVQIRLGQIAHIVLATDRYNILHRNGQRVQTVTCHLTNRDLNAFVQQLRTRLLNEVRYPPDVFPEITGAAIEQASARQELIVHAVLTGLGVLLLVYLAMRRLRLTLLTLLNLPFAFLGGVIVAVAQGGILSIGATVGFVTLFGITLRNSIMLISHYQYLVDRDGRPWSEATALQGAQERLPSILMTGIVTALAMLPITIDSDNPGREIMGPMAGIVIGGLLSSTLLNLLVLPVALLRWGRFETIGRPAMNPPGKAA